MPGLDKADVLAFLRLNDEPGCVLLYKRLRQFLYMRSMFLKGQWNIV